VPALYAYTASTIAEIPAYLAAGNPPDAPGHFLAWLCGRKPVYVLRCESGPHDIGTIETYREVDRLFS
jgi:glucose-1-phosphate thymidylyltransferase